MAKTTTDKLITVLLVAAALLIVTGGALALLSFRDGTGARQPAQTPEAQQSDDGLAAQLDEALAQGVFLPNVFVDGVALGGRTMDEAQALFIQKNADLESEADIEILGGDARWRLVGSDQIKLQDDRQAVLDAAYALGRGADRQQNLSDLEGLLEAPRQFTITRNFVISDLNNVVSLICTHLDEPAQDARILGYDSENQRFEFEEEKAGSVVDAQALANDIEAALVAASFPAQLTVPMIEQQPEVTQEQLAADFKLMGEFSTTAKNDKARNTNIALALESFNGMVLEVGQEFSMNTVTGERTQDKGYQVAGVILDGASSEDLGGGVCQASSTLFNAVARAGFEITERHPHSWPSDYIGAGFDAMINYPESDFKFVNSSEGPVYLFSSFDWDTRKLTVQIFGKPIYEEGLTVDLKHECVETIPEPDPIITLDDTKRINEVEVVRKGRSGSRWVTTRVFYKDGQEVRSEQLCTSYYRAIAAKMTVGTINDGNFATALPDPA